MAWERKVLSALKFNISLPTRIYFLNRFLLAAQVEEGKISGLNQHQQLAISERNHKEASFAYFLLDITLQNYGFNQYPMSVVAAAIVHYVKQCYRPLHELLWTHTLVFYTGYEERHLIPVVYAIQSFHSEIFNSEYISILRKYNCQAYRYCTQELSLSKERIRFDDVAAKEFFLCQQTLSENDDKAIDNAHGSNDLNDNVDRNLDSKDSSASQIVNNRQLNNMTPTFSLDEGE